VNLLKVIAATPICLIFLSSTALGGTFQPIGNTIGLQFSSGTPIFTQGTAKGSTGTGNSSCSISGTIKTIYQWVPAYTGESAPAKVLVIESCDISTTAKSFYDSGFVMPTGSSNNGMTATWSAQTDPDPTEIWSGGPISFPIGMQKLTSSKGTKASIVNVVGTGTKKVTVTSTVSASASAGNGTATAEITYSVVGVYPAEISVSGTKLAGNQLQILPGQLATGAMAVGGPDIGFDEFSFTWSASNDTFLDYVANADSGMATPVPASIWTSMNPQWRYVHDCTSRISCTASLRYHPSGFSAPVPGVIDGKTTVVSVPIDSNLNVTANSANGQFLQGTNLTLTSQPTTPNLNAIDIAFNATTPHAFLADGGGEVGIIQLLDPFLKYKRNGELTYDSNGIANDRGDDTGSTDILYPFSDQWCQANSNVGSGHDTPSFFVLNTSDVYSLETILTAKNYSMYRAPGSTSQPVPLKIIGWEWKAKATKTNGVWNQDYNTITADQASVPQTSHPNWTHAFRLGSG
jgi:hypothetical protein